MNADWVQQLKGQFGDAVTTDAGAFSVQGVAPACVCAPADEAQAAAVIRVAAGQKIPVVPCGGGTAQGIGYAPPKDFLALSTRRMNKLIHHEPGDMVATVQGGMSVGAFQEAIRAGGQWLPIDAPNDATIGGIVAANTHGPRAYGYGTLRDMILGMTVVNGDGVVRKCGGKVVKNVTGYSLDKLYIGSLGTLGVVTEVTFKLRPLSVNGRFWNAQARSIQIGADAVRAIAAKNLPIEMLQLNRAGANEGVITLLVCAAGTDAELARIDSELRSSAPPLELEGIFHCPETASGQTPAEFAYTQSWTWSAYELSLLDAAKPRNSKGALLRFGCVASKLDAALIVLSNYVTAPFSIGVSGGMVDHSPLSDAEAVRIATEFEKLGVNFSFENVVGVNIPNRFGSPRPEWAIMKQIKAALDPAGVMNPGRFVV